MYHKSIFTMTGRGSFSEQIIFGISFYKRITIQEWTPILHEYTIERGIRIKSWRLGLSNVIKYFIDNKYPAFMQDLGVEIKSPYRDEKIINLPHQQFTYMM